ncbi:D-amino acid oxidase [Geothrix limicola]|uniref:D-amino acid oxidase n=1 Tax=Geothrix limicola TaxID=2927978 RepID=A0ABQ5QAS3_9BACT|nr:FAD-dependent oxidoreductase [Geothrix limicola]GLH71717.1 D-amino acid oxidase [Geothrix limicola]
MNPDVLIVGGGVVGAACAQALATEGCRVTLLEAEGLGGGATAAAMGHLVALDGSDAELALCRLGQARWNALAPDLGAALELDPCGTLWVAADEEEMALVKPRCEAYRAAGIEAELLDARALHEAEPHLAPHLPGGMRVPGDSVIYPPAGARLLAEAAQRAGARILTGIRVASLEPHGLRLADGTALSAGCVVLAAGSASKALIPRLPLVRRKGHLAITERRPGFLHHQLVELGYLKSAHGSDTDSVAFNLQPRPNGQLLLGSSRQFGDEAPDIRTTLLRRMIEQALSYVPDLAQVSVVRAWTGFRPITPDHRPLIGPLPGHPGVLLACGHEGLGITTAPATAELIAAEVLGRKPAIDPAPYLPSRFPELAHA